MQWIYKIGHSVRRLLSFLRSRLQRPRQSQDGLVTMNYRIRLRVRLAKALNSPETAKTFLFDGREVSIRSQKPDQPLSESKWVIFGSGGFETEELAREAGERLKDAVLIAGLACRLGIDVGNDTPSAWVQEEFARANGFLNADERLVQNIHGLTIVIDDDKNRTLVVEGAGRVLASPDKLSEALVELGAEPHENLRGANAGVRLLNSALISAEPLSKLVLSLSAVEELGQDETWTNVQVTLLESLSSQAQVWEHCSKAERNEVAEALRRGMHRISLRQGVLRVLRRLDLIHLRQEWDRIYGLRSGIFHGTERLSEPEMAQVAEDAFLLCGRIVLTIARMEGVTPPTICAIHFPDTRP